VTTRGVTLAVAIAAATIGATQIGRAEQTASGDVLLALLSEVRGLRAAMEQVASVTPAIQLGLGRLQIHEQRIVNQARRLDELRLQIEAVQAEVERNEQLVGELDTLLHTSGSATTSLEERNSNEAALKSLKGDVARGRIAVQRLRNDEAQMLQDIAAEQGRWTELNLRLEQLERELSPRR
jgi:hypothetical protein